MFYYNKDYEPDINNTIKYVIYTGDLSYSFDRWTTELMLEKLVPGKLYLVKEEGFYEPRYQLDGVIGYYPSKSFLESTKRDYISSKYNLK